MKRIDWTLVAIAMAGTTPLQPVQIQKILFLIGKNLNNQQLKTRSYYRFEPYDYGPFCSSIYSDAELLEHESLVTIHRPPESRYKLYQITELGAEKVKKLEKGIDDEVIKYVRTVVEFTQSVSFNQLISTIYKRYPEMKVNSVFHA